MPVGVSVSTGDVAPREGIAVGGYQCLGTAELRPVVAGRGWSDVHSHSQSGNRVLDGGDASPYEVARSVERAIADGIGLGVLCSVRTARELRATAAGNPCGGTAAVGSRLPANFLIVYQWCPGGVLAGPALGPYFKRDLQLAVPARNWNTVPVLDRLSR